MNRRRFLMGMGAAAGAGVGGLAYARFVEPGWVEFTEHPLPPPASGNPPAGDRPGGGSGAVGWPGIVQISDLHLRRIGDVHREIAAEVGRRAPDVIVVTGDSVNATESLPALAEFLAMLPAATPKLAILGNWEHWGRVDPDRLRRVYDAAGCELLVNRSVLRETLGGVVRISGVDDLVGGRPDLGALLHPRGDADLHLLLAHCPAHRDRLPVGAAFDLVLSGHTHGGQVQVFGHAPLVPWGSGRYVEGWYHDGGPPMYVSRGVGTSVLPVRFGARPEVTFFSPRG